MKNQRNLPSFAWPHVIALAWELLDDMQSRGLEMDWKACSELFGPGGFEVAVRDNEKQEAFRKMIPNTIVIATAYLELGGAVDDWFLQTMAAAAYAGKQDEYFAHFGWTSANTNAAKLLYILACRLAEEKSTVHAAHFLWRFHGYAVQTLTRQERSMLEGLELQSGLGLFAAICHARVVLPDLLPEELAGTMIKKYGIPDRHLLPSCSWCGSIPCVCSGRKSTARVVSADDVATFATELTPWHTMQCMELCYGLARNAGIGGEGYGLARVAYERAEAAVAELFLKADGNPDTLQDMLGPMFYAKERSLGRYETRGSIGASRARHDYVAELGDTIQWLMLILPGKLDHARGLVEALKTIAAQLEIELVLPTVPEISLPPLLSKSHK